LTGDAEIFSLCTDSRIATEGDLFFCFCGGNIDSHDCAEEAVRRADDCIRRVGVEIHRMKGFIRFFETESGALYAACAPDHDIVDLLIPHFRARIPHFPFVIHDVKRKKAAVWDTEHSFLAPLDRAEIIISANENAWQNLWKQYYASVNIPSRERLKQMRGYLPVRYMKFMPEFSVRHDGT